MSTRIIVYEEEPNFPATDQHPDAVRYYLLPDDTIVTELPRRVVPQVVVDAIGAPTLAEIDAIWSATWEGKGMLSRIHKRRIVRF